MWSTAEAVLAANEKVWTGLDAFAAAVQNFRDIRKQIDPRARSQKSATIGIALDKQAVRNELTVLVNQLAANLQAYAAVTHNNTLQEQVHFGPSHFTRLRDNMLPVIVRSLLEKAEAQEQALIGYGITAAGIDEIKNVLNQYETINTAPRLAIGDRKKATSDMALQIKEGNNQLEVLDKLAGNFADNAPGFVAAFRNARIIIHHGGHKSIKSGKSGKDTGNT